jgi:cytolysin-activating lysine-acyltransferase
MAKAPKKAATTKAGARGKPVANGTGSAAKAAPAKAPQAASAAGDAQDARARLHADIGQLTLAMMNLPRYRHQSLADLRHLILDPLTRDRIAMARSKQGSGEDATVGVAIWASVSAAVAAKIAEQVKAGVFPIRLAPEDWSSGDLIWLIDLIAPNRQLATAVLLNFRKATGLKPMQIHPNVSKSIEKEVLDKLRANPKTGAKHLVDGA